MKNTSFGVVINIIIAALLSAGAVLFPVAAIPVMAVSSVFFAVRANRGAVLEIVFMLISSAVAIFTLKGQAGFTADIICGCLSAFCLTALGGAAVGLLTKYKFDFRMVLAGGTVAFLASYLIDFANLKFIHNLNLSEELINKPVKLFFETYEEILTASGSQSVQSIIDALGDLQWYMQQVMAAITPSILIIICAFFAYATFLVSRKFIFAKHKEIMEYPHFWQLQFPKSSSIAFAVLFILTFFISSSTLLSAITNVIIILSAFYMLCGLSVADFFLRKSGVHWALRIAVYIFAFVILTIVGVILPIANIWTILLFLGVIDAMFDFRKLRGERHEA